MSIFPLPQFEADLEADKALHAKMEPPKTVVVRFGALRQIGEFPFSGDVKPGCGSKIVVRTYRGLEIGEMLTSTCPNAGCSKSVTRKEMLEYIDNSGGRDYPFFTDGKALRVATVEDVNRQSALDGAKNDMIKEARALARELDLKMKIVDAEPILGGERLTFYFTAEDRVDFRELARRLAEKHKTRIELHQVGARDEARLNADYERCGQHCCCRQFLKVLKPVSMKSAKVQKATLDPLKISGRCGRLMCCLRYEDQTYTELRKRLPNRGKTVGTPEGVGRVIDTQILTQLALVELESDRRRVAVPVEELCPPEEAPRPLSPHEQAMRGLSEKQAEERTDDRKRSRKKGGKPRSRQQDEYREKSQGGQAKPGGPAPAPDQDADAGASEQSEKGRKSRGRRRGGRGRSRRDGAGGEGGAGPQDQSPPSQPPGSQAQGSQNGEGKKKKKRRRRRGGRRGKGGDGGGDSGDGGDNG